MESPILLVAIGGFLLTVGDIVFKYWVGNEKMSFYGFGLLIYIAALMFLVQSYKFENIAIASTMLVVFNIVSLAIASWFLFGEKLSLLQIMGICLAIIAILLFELAK